jgi:hypothetical protein
MTLAAVARGRKNAISEPDSANFSKFQTILKEATVER